MLSKEEIALRSQRRDSLKSVGVGLSFGASLVSELQNLHVFGDTKAKINDTAENALEGLDRTYKQVAQNDLTRAILSGIDINSGSIAQVVAQRKGVLATEKQRLQDERTRALSSVSDQESNSFWGSAANFLIGALKWLL